MPPARPTCSCEGLTQWLGRAWSKRKTSGHLKCRSPCHQTLLRKGLIAGLVPFSSFTSTEEWLELCDLFHQHLRLKSHCRVLVRNELKPFLKTHSAILMSISDQEGKEREILLKRMCIWKGNKNLHQLHMMQDPKMNKLCSQGV